jgi:hypothetical protein
MTVCTTDQCAPLVSVEVENKRHLCLVGNWTATRKNPPVTSAGSKLDILLSYLCFTWTVISTTAINAIYEQFV